MHYACIENSIVTGILNYKPNTPSNVTIIEIEDEENDLIFKGKKKYDPNSKKFVDAVEQKTPEQIAIEKRLFLKNSDWKVLRHIREKSLGLPTSLTEEEYLALENERQAIAQSI